MAKEIIEDLGDVARFVELKDCGHSPLVDRSGPVASSNHRIFGLMEIFSKINALMP